MPKFNGWQGFGRKDSNNSTSFPSSQQQQQHQRVIRSIKIGAFPMPPLKVQRKMETFVSPLDAYRQLWDEECVGDNKGVAHDAATNSAILTTCTREDNLEFRRELFSRRLQAGTVRIERKPKKMLCV